ncbi:MULTISPECIES: hypothetical protein [unclassified Thioalkalivibrio]|uniref:hypothetical protein n=1 Tax=unclassified Thioalkalivibrio TaxID=2621013 RepID=UPI00036941A5|nr:MULTISPECIES: hypothetical protein [unclassified Thioalkalivibrio]
MIRLLLTLAALNVVLLGLDVPRHAGIGPHWLAWEAVLLVGLFALLPAGRLARALAWLAGFILLALVVLALFDALTRISLVRPLNVIQDWILLDAVWRLVTGNLDVWATVGLVVVLVAGLVAIIAGAARGLFALTVQSAPGRRIPLSVAVGLFTLGLVGALGSMRGAAPPGTAAPGMVSVQEQIVAGQGALAENRAFRERLEQTREQAEGRPLPGLGDVDVILGLVESYGVSAVFDERYAPVIVPSLDFIGEQLDDADLHVVTGVLEAPIAGGQSWLAQASLLTGLQVRYAGHYDALQAQTRDTLVQDFQATGHETAMLAPAIQLDWPEGQWFRWDRIVDKHGFEYAGPPFFWVTMPDQYTWSFFEREIRGPSERPVFAMLALISSHAPWTPILPVLEDWEAIGDGAVFDEWAGKGPTPESLWRDFDRVREYYAESVRYSLEVTGGYAARYVDEDTLFFMLGDHQPAALVTGQDASWAVPVHVISGDPALLEPFREYGFVPGMQPPSERAEHGFDALRGWLREAFGTPPGSD